MILGRAVLRGALPALLVWLCSLAPSASAAEVPLETYAPYGAAAPVATTADPLTDGRRYVVTVRGTFSFWSAAAMSSSPPSGRTVCGTPEDAPLFPSPDTTNGRVSDDPEFALAQSISGTTCSGVFPRRLSPLRFSTDGGSSFHSMSTIDVPSAPTAGHDYDYGVTGAGQPLQVKLSDSYYADNFGQLRVAVAPDAAPVVTTSAGATDFTEQGPGVAVDPALTLSDADSTTIAGATITITNAPASGEDRLALPSTPGIAASYNPSAATLTLTGRASVADYQAALRSVAYQDVSEAPNGDTRHVSFVVRDREGAASDAATRDVTLSVADVTERSLESYAPYGVPAPVFTSPYNLVSGRTYLVKVRGTFSFWSAAAMSSSPPAGRVVCGTPEDAPLYASPATTNGRVSDDPEFEFAQSLAGTSCGTAAYPKRLSALRFSTDGSSFASVAPIGDPPTAPSADHAYSYNVTGAGEPLRIKLNDSYYPDNFGQFRVSLAVAPVITTSSGSAAFIEDAGAVAVDPSLTLTDADSTDIAGAEVRITGAPATSEDRLALPSTPGISAFYDEATSTLFLNGTRPVADYEAALRSVTYEDVSHTPDTATRHVAFTATDTDGATSAAASRDVTVTAVDDAPVVTTTSGAVSYTENDPATTVDSTLTVADPDSATLKQATVTIPSGADALDRLTVGDANGLTVTGSGTDSLTLTGVASTATYADALRTVAFDNAGDDPGGAARTVRFVVTDDTDTSSAAADREVDVTPVNDTPVAHDDSLTTTEDAALTDDVRANDTDPDNSTSSLTVSEVDGSASNVATEFTTANGAKVTVGSDGSLSYDPRGAFDDLQTGDHRDDTFTYKVKDPANAESSSATVTVRVTGVNDAPNANSKLYNGVANTTFELQKTGVTGASGPKVRVDGDLLATVTDPDDAAADLSVENGTVASTDGGTATLNSDGTFTYVSAAGDTAASDAFPYTVDDAHGGSTTRNITINLKDRVWYVDSSAAAGGDGTSPSPFDALPSSVGQTGDTVYVETGAASTGGAITLKSNQKLIGQGEALSVNLGPTGTPSGPTTLAAAGTRPTVDNATGDTVTLAGGNQVRSINVNSSGSPGSAITNTGTGVTIHDVAVGDTGTGAAVKLASAGTVTATNLDITTSSATGLSLNGATADISDSSTVDATGGPAVSLTSVGGSIALASAKSTNSSGAGIAAASSDASFTAAAGTIKNAAGNAVDLNGGAGAFSFPGTIENGSGYAAKLVNRGADTTLGGSITGAGGLGISVTGAAASTTTAFDGVTKTLSTGSNPAVALSGNSGLVRFGNGGLAITTTGANNGFDATGGGTLEVRTGTNPNTISTATGTALKIDGPDITSNGVTFRSISAAGAPNGIFLKDTGSAGGLTVTGDGALNGSGLIDRNNSGGDVTASGGDGTTNGIAVFLSGVSGVALNQMHLHDNGNYALRGAGVSGLTLGGVLADAPSGHNGTSNSGTADYSGVGGEGTAVFTALSGTVSIVNSRFSKGYGDNLRVANGSGTLNLTMDHSDVRDDGLGNGVLFDAQGTAALNATVTNSTFAANPEDHIQYDASGSGTSSFTFKNNTLTGGAAGAIGQNMTVGAGGDGFTGRLNYDVENNALTGSVGTAITAHLGRSPATGTMVGTIKNNTIGDAATVGSGTGSAGYGIGIDSLGHGTHTLLVQGNQVFQYGDRGVALTANDGDGRTNLSVLSNTIAHPSNVQAGGSREPLYISLGATSANAYGAIDSNTACLNLSGNSLQAGAATPDHVRLRTRFQTHAILPGYGGSTDAAASAFLASTESVFGGGTVVGDATTSATFPPGSTIAGGSACPTP